MIAEHLIKLRNYLDGNTLFFRVLVFLWGSLLAAAGMFVVLIIDQPFLTWWFLAYAPFIACFGHGAWLMCLSLVTSDEVFEEKHVIHDGASEASIILIALFILAFPITLILERWFGEKDY